MTRLCKIGKEVEGQYLGLDTIFCNASELPNVLKNLQDIVKKYKIKQLYISEADSLSQDDINTLGYLSLQVTLELAYPNLDIVRPLNVSYMVSVPISPISLGFFSVLRKSDQIKFHNDNYVAVARGDNFSLTTPDDFEDDFDISESDI